MAIEVVSNALVLAGGYNLSGVANAAAVSERADLRDATVLASTGRVRKAGLPAATARVEGFFEGTAEAGLDAGLALVDVPLSIAHRDAEGEVAYFFKAIYADLLALGGTIGEMARMSLTAESSSGAKDSPMSGAVSRALIRGYLGTHQTAAVASGTGTGFAISAVGAAQYLYGALHVYGAGAADTLDVVIESDDNAGFTSATTRITFAQKTAIGYEWATPVAGAIADTYWRVKWTIGGVDPSFAFAVVLGIL